MTARFSGRAAVVTGGGSGIGAAAARRLAAEGARVAVLDRDAAKAEAVAREVGGLALAADVADGAALRAALAQAHAAFGPLHALLGNAATMTFTPLLDTPEADFDRVLAVNLRAAWLLARHGVPLMAEGGAMAFTSSVHAHATTANVAPYAATKGGIEALARALAIELEPRRIRVNCVAPGAVDTPMLRDNPNIRSGAEVLSGAIGQPEDIAAALAFLLSDDARFVTGATLIADGGRLARL